MPSSVRRLLCVAGCLGGLATASTFAQLPNILLIVSDDQGYADAGFQGSADILTPHLDRLAREGLRCTQGYVSHPFCSPTRAGLMTGRYQQRFGHETNPIYDVTDEREGLPVTETLLPERLKPAGYRTGWIGKWHLGAAPCFHPLNRGFDETFGFLGGGHRYLNWEVDEANDYFSPLERNGRPVDVPEHLTTRFGSEAAAFIRRQQGPWFLYLAFNAPHGPLEPTPERLARFAHLPDPRRAAYAAQVSLMDDAIGETLDALRAAGQREQTLVFFFSDNGGPIGERSNGSSNEPLRGGKSLLYEGGVRVPFLVSWPTRLPEGVDYELPVSSLDVFATSLAAAGVPLPEDRVYDSVNLLPFLAGEISDPPHRQLFWRNSNRGTLAIRAGDEKLLAAVDANDELYQLDRDSGETQDLAATQPSTAQRLRTALDAWNAELIAPAFPGMPERRARIPPAAAR